MRRTKADALETREALLDAAEHVFFEKGVSRTTLSDIAGAAGVTRGALYWHFSGKADLFAAMQERALMILERHATIASAADDALPLQALKRTALAMLSLVASDAQLRRIMTISLLRCEYVGEMSEANTLRRDTADKVEKIGMSVFQNAARNNQLHSNWTPHSALDAHRCVMVGLITEWLRTDAQFPLVERAQQVLGVLFEAFENGNR